MLILLCIKCSYFSMTYGREIQKGQSIAVISNSDTNGWVRWIRRVYVVQYVLHYWRRSRINLHLMHSTLKGYHPL